MATMSKKSSKGNGSGPVEPLTFYGPIKLEVKGPHQIIAGKDSKLLYLADGEKVEVVQSAGIPEVVEMLDDSPEKCAERASFNSPAAQMPTAAARKAATKKEPKKNDVAASSTTSTKKSTAAQKKAAQKNVKAKQDVAFKTPAKMASKKQAMAAFDADLSSESSSDVEEVSKALGASNIKPKADDKMEVSETITTSRPTRAGRGKAKKGGSD